MSDIYQIVLNQIIYKLESGVVPWRCPWSGGLPQNFVTNRAYSGLNVILLGMLEYNQPYFLTWNQIRKLGHRVKEEEKPHLVVYYKPTEVEEEETDPETGEVKIVKNTRYLMRYYRIYNIQQTSIPVPVKEEFNPIERCENVVEDMPSKPVILHKYLRAYYSPKQDMINMPDPEHFITAENYYSTLFHELIHSTGHKKRLNRRTIRVPHSFGDPIYSQEELIAEMGSAFLCAHTGISNQTIEDSSAYIKGWLSVLKSNKKLAGNADLWENGNLENDPEFGSSGFDFLPGGYRYNYYGYFYNLSEGGYFWSSTEYSSVYAWYRVLLYYNTDVYRGYTDNQSGFSVRCVRD